MGLTQLLSAFGRARSVPSKGWKVLTTKQYKRMYKGKGSMKTGVHTQYGGFRVLGSMLPRYAVPDLEGFTLKPYVQNYPEQKDRGRGAADAGGAVTAAGQQQQAEGAP